MKTIAALAAVSVLALSVSASEPALAGGNGGAIAAGVVGGLAVGAIVGSQVNRNYYNGPAYVDQPAYVSGPQYYRGCHTERQEVVDAYGNYRIRRARSADQFRPSTGLPSRGAVGTADLVTAATTAGQHDRLIAIADFAPPLTVPVPATQAIGSSLYLAVVPTSPRLDRTTSTQCHRIGAVSVGRVGRAGRRRIPGRRGTGDIESGALRTRAARPG